MSKKKTLFFSKGSTMPPNTFIGGVGASTVTSAADFAALTSLSESDIQSFSIDANDNVSFYVDVNYSLTGINDNTEITYFIDSQGFILSLIGTQLRNCFNLEYLYLPNYTSGSNQFTIYDSSIERVNVESLNAIFGRVYLALSNAEKYDFRSLNSVNGGVSGGAITRIPNSKYIYLGSCTSISENERVRSGIWNVGRFPMFYQCTSNTKIYVANNSNVNVQDRKAFFWLN